MARHAASPLIALDTMDVHRLRLDALELLTWHDFLTATGYTPLPAESQAWAAKAAALLQEIAR
jgi:hypothetical protein